MVVYSLMGAVSTMHSLGCHVSAELWHTHQSD